MGLPKININFFGKMKPKNGRVAGGVVALILKDDSQQVDFIVYKPGDKIRDWSNDNTLYINQALAGGPREVKVVRVPEETTDFEDALNVLKYKRFDYLAIPEVAEGQTEAVAEWVKSKHKNSKKKIKAVLPNHAANHESVINFTAKEIKVGEEEFSTAQYTARIAGILAGLPFNRSATYYVLDEVDSVFEIDDPDAAVDNGELILINDGKNIKIGRGVNSLTTIQENENKNDDFKSIRVVAIMDMIHNEIYDNFNDNYIGKVPNTYDNQVLFLNEVNRGFSELADLDLLDPNFDNKAWVDVETQREAWELVGVDTTDWDEQQVKESAFKRHVYLAGRIRVVDTIEDLEFNIEI